MSSAVVPTFKKQRHPESVADLFERRRGKPGIAAGSGLALECRCPIARSAPACGRCDRHMCLPSKGGGSRSGLSEVCIRTRACVESWPPVHQERNRWRAGLSVDVDDEPSIASDVVLMTAANHVRPSAQAARLEQRRRHASFDHRLRGANRDRHHLCIGSNVVQLFPVVGPSRVNAAGGRDRNPGAG